MHLKHLIFIVFLSPLTLMAHGDHPPAGPPDTLFGRLNRARTDSARISEHIRIAVAMEASDYRMALEHATRAVQLSEKSGNYNLRIESYLAAGGAAMRKGLYEQAVDFFTRHYELARKAGDEVESGKAYFNLGSVHLLLQNFAKAREVFEEADRMMERGYRAKGIPVPDGNVLTFRMNLALCYMYLKDFPRCDSILTLSFPMAAGRPGLETQELSLYHIRAMMYFDTQQPEAALQDLQRARPLAVRMNDKPRLASIQMTEGQCLAMMGDTLAARRAYLEGLTYARRFNGIALMASISELLYQSYRRAGPADSTVKYFELFTDLQEQSKAEQAKETLMRQDLQRSYDRMVQEWERGRQTERRRNGVLAITILVVAVSAIVGVIYYRNRYRRLQLDRVQRELEARRVEMELLRQQAELGRRDAELERIRWQIEKQTLVEGLVGGLQAFHAAPARDGSDPKAPAGIPSSQRRSKAWEEFELRLQQIHNGFYERLNQRYPNLTINERRLCALLLLDMSTKEISDITGQTVRAVNLARIRLRKKFGISHTDKELFAFLTDL